jgi:hypothetical protein
MVRRRNPPSQTWRTFLENTYVCLSTFSRVPTIRFQVLYVFLVLAHDRRRIRAFQCHRASDGRVDWDSNCARLSRLRRCRDILLRDRDGIFGADFTKEVRNLGIEEVLGAAFSVAKGLHRSA